jgi:hypothetical protein
MRNVKATVFLFVAAIVLAVLYAPWKQWAEWGIIYLLQKEGYGGTRVTLDSLTLKEAKLSDVSLGKKVPVTFDVLVFRYTFDGLKVSKATLAEASGAWSGGSFLISDADIAWAGVQRFRGAIKVKSVPFGPLLKAATGGRADATGIVSGVLPMTIYADGTFFLKQATLKAEKPGTFHMSPDLISGENNQLIQVREALTNFHYSELELTATSDKTKKLSMLLKLYGNNPKVYNGRAVKLNVRVQGDLLSLFQQSVLPIANPKQFLEQKSDAKK